MPSYTITITPDDGVGAETVVKLQIDGNTPRITKLELTAAAGATLATSQLPAINLEMLLASVQPAITPYPTPTPAIATATVQQPAADDIPAATPREREPATGHDRTKPAATAAAVKPAPKATKKPATGKTAASAKKTQAKPESTGRAYRTMPGDFAAVYQQASSVGAVADHYGVPRHTAQNWVATARRRDLIPAGQRRKGAKPAASTGQGLFLAPAAIRG
jgi:hypothetical protein